MITGGVTSFTVTVKVQPFVLPDPSVTTQVTSVPPLLKAVPLMVPVPLAAVAPVSFHALLAAGIGVAGQLSVAVISNSVPCAVYEQVPAVVLRLVVAGQASCGNSLSNMVTLKLQLPELPEASDAFQLTSVVPLLKDTPLREAVLAVPVVAPDKV